MSIKKLKDIIEDYHSTSKSSIVNTPQVDLYINPTLKDIKDIKNNPVEPSYSRDLFFRFLVDTSNDDLYIWDGRKGLHWDVMKHLNKKNDKESEVVGGTIQYREGMTYYYFDSIMTDEVPEWVVKKAKTILMKRAKNLFNLRD